MAKVNKEALFKKRLGERDVEVPDVGTVRVRALTRKEIFGLGLQPGAEVELDMAEAERKILAYGMVDPQLTEDEVGAWQEASPAGELNIIFTEILDLSGLAAEDGGKGLVKDAMKRFQG